MSRTTCVVIPLLVPPSPVWRNPDCVVVHPSRRWRIPIFLISPLLIRRLGRKAADRDAAASRVQRSLPEACSVVAV